MTEEYRIFRISDLKKSLVHMICQFSDLQRWSVSWLVVQFGNYVSVHVISKLVLHFHVQLSL